MVWLHRENHSGPSLQPTLTGSSGRSSATGGQEWQLTQALAGFQRVVEEQRKEASDSAEELKHKVQRLGENLDSRLEGMQKEQEDKAQKRHYQVTKLLGEQLGTCHVGELGTCQPVGESLSQAALGEQLECLRRDLQELSEGVHIELASLREAVVHRTWHKGTSSSNTFHLRPNSTATLTRAADTPASGVEQPPSPTRSDRARGHVVGKMRAHNPTRTKSVGDLSVMGHLGRPGDSHDKFAKSWKVQAELHISALQQVQGWYKSRSKFSKDIVPSGLEKFRPAVETISSVVIVMNLMYMGLEVEYRLAHSLDEEPEPRWLFYVEVAFASLFALEILFRAAMERMAFLTGKNRKWNLCDALLVMVQITDLSFSVIDLSFLRSMRSLRSLQAIRIIRTITWVRELRLMLAAIWAALTPLMWSFLLLLLVLYLFALCLAQTVEIYLSQVELTAVHKNLPRFYGSLGQTMVTLFMAISGGKDWQSLLEPLQQISQVYTLFMMVYITFVLLGMLNILTAIFVESTKMIAEVDSELAIQEHLERENSVINKVRSFLQRNANADGRISREDFESKLMNPRFQAQLSMLDLDVHEAEGVFKIMNVHESDEVNIEEFIYGLVRLKGNAKAVDIISMLYESRRISKRLTAFMNYTEASFQDLREDLGLPPEGGGREEEDDEFDDEEVELELNPQLQRRTTTL